MQQQHASSEAEAEAWRVATSLYLFGIAVLLYDHPIKLCKDDNVLTLNTRFWLKARFDL